MAKAKSPAYQFYPSDYISDAHVMAMTAREEGLYIRLLSTCWLENGISSDPEILLRMAKRDTTIEDVKVVLKRFIAHPSDPSKLHHKRLIKESKKQAEWRNKSSHGGQVSAKKRWGSNTKEENKGGYDLVNGSLKNGSKQKVTSQSSSSITVNTPLAPFGEASVVEVVDAWNATSLPKCIHLTDKRRRAIKARLRSDFWRNNWRPALEIISKSAFCNGQNDRGWAADIGWFAKNDDIAANAIEGKYGTNKKEGSSI